MARPRLKIGDISIEEIKILSEHLYKKDVDNKARRATIDVTDAKISATRNLRRIKGKWEQVGREIKFEFIIKTKPVSYKKSDNIPVHKFPVTFLLRDYNQGFNSAFRWRTGSFRKPKFPKRKISEGKDTKAKARIRKENQQIQNSNIRNGIQMQFFFDLEWVLNRWGLLYGPDWTDGPPVERNPKVLPFFDKHAYFIVTRILPHMLTTYGDSIKKTFNF